MDHTLRSNLSGPPQRLCRSGLDLRVDGDHLPHRVGAHHRPAPAEHGIAPGRLRLGFALVWRAAVAVRGVLAVPDSRAAAGEVELPGDHGSRQAQHPWPELRAAVPRGLDESQQVRPDSERLREPHPCRPETRARVPRLFLGQHLEDEATVSRRGRDARPQAVRLDPNAGLTKAIGQVRARLGAGPRPFSTTTRLYAHLAFTDPEKSVRERKTIVPVLGRSTSRQTGALARGRPLTVYT